MPDNPPTISAVIIGRNEQATIRPCIKSVLEQKVDIAEVIVVDGNSQDHTLRYASDLARKYEQVQVVVEEAHAADRGPGAARNTGAALASGEFLLFLNGDIVLDPGYVSNVLAAMSDRNLDAASGFRWNIRRSLVGGLINVHYALNYHTSPETLASPDHLVGDALLIRTESFWSVGGYEPGMPAGEDADLGYRLRGCGVKLGYCDATAWHEDRRHESLSEWVKQLERHSRGAAALADTYSWRLGSERARIRRHVALPLSALFIFLLVITIVANVSGPLAWGVGALAVAAAGVRYLKAAVDVQRRCESVSLPTTPLPQDFVLYPLFRFARNGLLSLFTWRALLVRRRSEGGQRSRGRAL